MWTSFRARAAQASFCGVLQLTHPVVLGAGSPIIGRTRSLIGRRALDAGPAAIAGATSTVRVVADASRHLRPCAAWLLAGADVTHRLTGTERARSWSSSKGGERVSALCSTSTGEVLLRWRACLQKAQPRGAGISLGARVQRFTGPQGSKAARAAGRKVVPCSQCPAAT